MKQETLKSFIFYKEEKNVSHINTGSTYFTSTDLKSGKIKLVSQTNVRQTGTVRHDGCADRCVSGRTWLGCQSTKSLPRRTVLLKSLMSLMRWKMDVESWVSLSITYLIAVIFPWSLENFCRLLIFSTRLYWFSYNKTFFVK